MEDKKKLRIITADGQEKEYKIICAFSLSNTGKNYVIYTDGTKNENDKTKVYASIYYPNDDTKLDEIKTEEEWDIIDSVLNSLGDIEQ